MKKKSLSSLKFLASLTFAFLICFWLRYNYGTDEGGSSDGKSYHGLIPTNRKKNEFNITEKISRIRDKNVLILMDEYDSRDLANAELILPPLVRFHNRYDSTKKTVILDIGANVGETSVTFIFVHVQ